MESVMEPDQPDGLRSDGGVSCRRVDSARRRYARPHHPARM